MKEIMSTDESKFNIEDEEDDKGDQNDVFSKLKNPLKKKENNKHVQELFKFQESDLRFEEPTD
jgi:hypothetical protein